MVHALKEACRCLAAGGTLVDVRPLSLDAPVEVLTQQGWESADLVDMSPDLPDDRAVDETLQEAIAAGTLKEVSLETFDFLDYWDHVEDMKAHFDEYWKDEAVLPEAVLERARRLYESQPAGTKVRLRRRMKLGAYTSPH